MISFSMLQMGFLISLDESYLGGPLELGAQTTVEVVKMSYYLTTYILRILEIHMRSTGGEFNIQAMTSSYLHKVTGMTVIIICEECVVFAPFNVEEMNM
jgi:hypothetical protein